MIKIFESFNKEFDLTDDAHLLIDQNPKEAISQIDTFFEKIYDSFIEKDIDCIFELYNSILQKDVQKHLIEKAYQFFIIKISIMLEIKMYSGIQTLLDLFWHNWDRIDWSNIERNVKFLNNTYPLLFCKDASAEIASEFYWDLISKDKYNSENTNLRYEFKENHLERYNYLFGSG